MIHSVSETDSFQLPGVHQSGRRFREVVSVQDMRFSRQLWFKSWSSASITTLCQLRRPWLSDCQYFGSVHTVVIGCESGCMFSLLLINWIILILEVSFALHRWTYSWMRPCACFVLPCSGWLIKGSGTGV